MVINENNSQINAFVKGMNSDTAYDHLDNQQYVYAKNVRITKNDSINNSSTNNFSSVHEGAVTPVPKGVSEEHNEEGYVVDGDFLGSDSIGDIAVVITKYNNELRVYRAKINNNPVGQNTYTSGFTLWWHCDIQNVEAVSTVAYQELEGVIKLYIATGVYPIIEIRIDDNTGPYSGKQDVDYFINNRILPIYPVYIENKIDGSLKTSQVQYTYRYYNKFGTTTQLAPLTNKIQVIDGNRSKETGNAQDTTTSVGFTLKIRNTNDYPAYNRLQIYRLSYIVPGEDANVALIYDGDVDTKNSSSFSFNDVGTTPLQELTMQEFAAMSGMVIIPKVIEQNQQYMFAANVKDDTIINIDSFTGGNVQTVRKNVIISNSIDGIPTHNTDAFTDTDILNYFADRSVNSSIIKNSYNDIFTSSLLRSLRRGEDYVYGIVYYDKYGRHSNVHEITSGVSVPKINISSAGSGTPIPIAQIDNQKLVANIYGVNITLPQPNVEGIIGCQIVRRSSKSIYQKTLLQVALARPVKQSLYNTQIQNSGNVINNHAVPDGVKKDSPYYPSGFLWSDDVSIGPGMYFTSGGSDPDSIYKVDYDFITNTKTLRLAIPERNRFIAHSFDNINLFQIFSSEIDFRRDDVLSVLKQNTMTLSKLYACSISSDGDSSSAYNTSISSQLGGIQTHFEPNLISSSANNADYAFDIPGFVDYGHIYRWSILQTADSKTNQKLVFPLYYYRPLYNGPDELDIKSIKDVKLPQWFDGFSNLQLDGATVSGGGIKKYKQFETNIDQFVFNNWISFALYDNKISYDDNQPNAEDVSSAQFLSGDTSPYEDGAYIKNRNSDFFHGHTTDVGFGERRGWIGPGTSCFVMTVDNSNENALKSNYNRGCQTAICNIQHQISTVQNEPDEFIQYFGFGNFFKLEENRDPNDNSLLGYRVVHNYTYNDQPVKNTTMTVFDGDIYITPQEISTMYKTYDFMSYDTLQSMQITNYVPMESKVNTFFDYGMNLMNTNSANLMTEPGSIDGVTTQDRPVHQYNQIYSANDESNDVFTLVVEKAEDNNFKQRTYYSEPKTNGEYVDNFVIFKPAAYIDVDPKYGEVTNLLTDKNTLYYWQDTAFGKFSVNERSLINDTNGNTIMLGQAGILSRNDYISTKYGMRPFDYCATCAENGVYWVDVNNRAVVGGNSNECVNLGETLNVQNIINAKISENIPRVDYDLQNNELLCKCFNGGEQIVFNLKHKMATSVYNRNYEDIISIQNHIYGYINDDSKDIITRYNYLKSDTEFMSPMQIDFVVNHASSTTKVFDSQQLVPMKRKGWLSTNREDETTYFEDSLGTNGSLSFETDINSTTNIIQPYTDREGNIIYNIPRFGNGDWGNRLRGKWMRVNMNYGTPTEYTTISHVITKFRQSYS